MTIWCAQVSHACTTPCDVMCLTSLSAIQIYTPCALGVLEQRVRNFSEPQQILDFRRRGAPSAHPTGCGAGCATPAARLGDRREMPRCNQVWVMRLTDTVSHLRARTTLANQRSARRLSDQRRPHARHQGPRPAKRTPLCCPLIGSRVPPRHRSPCLARPLAYICFVQSNGSNFLPTASTRACSRSKGSLPRRARGMPESSCSSMPSSTSLPKSAGHSSWFSMTVA